MLISLLEVYQKQGALMGVLGEHQGFLTGDLEDQVIHNIMDTLGGPKGRYQVPC